MSALDREKARAVATSIARGDYDTAEDAVDALEECVVRLPWVKLREAESKLAAIETLCDDRDELFDGEPFPAILGTVEIRAILLGEQQNLTRKQR